MKRRTFGDVAAAAADQERDDVIGLIGERIADIDAFAKKRRITAAEADMLKRRLRAFADDLAAGLHRPSGRSTESKRGTQ
jgi:hypothetical protein